MTALLDQLAFYWGLTAAVVAPAVYGLTAKWWRNPFGRYWMVQGLVIVLVYAKGFASLVSGAPLHVSWSNVSVNVLVAILMTYQAWVIIRLSLTVKRPRDEQHK